MVDVAEWWWTGPFKCWERLSLPKCWSPDFHNPKYSFLLFGRLEQSRFFWQPTTCNEPEYCRKHVLLLFLVLVRKYYIHYLVRNSSKNSWPTSRSQRSFQRPGKLGGGGRSMGSSSHLCKDEVFRWWKIVMASSITFISWTVSKHFRCSILHDTACTQSLAVRAPCPSCCWSSFYSRSPSFQNKANPSTKWQIFKNYYCQ